MTRNKNRKTEQKKVEKKTSLAHTNAHPHAGAREIQ